MQVMTGLAANNTYAAFRIARACYVKIIDEGFDKEQAAAFKADCLSKLKGKASVSEKPKPEEKVAKPKVKQEAKVEAAIDISQDGADGELNEEALATLPPEAP